MIDQNKRFFSLQLILNPIRDWNPAPPLAPYIPPRSN